MHSHSGHVVFGFQQYTQERKALVQLLFGNPPCEDGLDPIEQLARGWPLFEFMVLPDKIKPRHDLRKKVTF